MRYAEAKLPAFHEHFVILDNDYKRVIPNTIITNVIINTVIFTQIFYNIKIVDKNIRLSNVTENLTQTQWGHFFH